MSINRKGRKGRKVFLSLRSLRLKKELRVFPSCVKNNFALFALFAVEKRTSRLSVLAYLPLAPYLSRKRSVSGSTRNAPSAFSMRTTAVRRGDTTESDWWVWST